MRVFLFLMVLFIPGLSIARIVIVDDSPATERKPDLVQNMEVTAVITPAPEIVPVWQAVVGSRLRESIQKWVDAANAGKPSSDKWTLVWDTTVGVDQVINYSIDAPLKFQGSVDKAVGNCIRLYEGAKVPLTVDINLEQKLLFVHIKYR